MINDIDATVPVKKPEIMNANNDYAEWVKIGKAIVADQLKFNAMTKEGKTG